MSRTLDAPSARRPMCSAPTPPPIKLPCPACGEPAANFVVQPYDPGEMFLCGACEASFGFDQMRRIVNVWPCVLARVSAMSYGLYEDLESFDADGLPVQGEPATLPMTPDEAGI
jgi:hypothetical protein